MSEEEKAIPKPQQTEPKAEEKPPSEVPTEEKGEPEEVEDPKEIARTMLMDDVAVEEIAKETGLKKRTIWALKGALARAGKIPKKAERVKREKIKELAGLPPEGEPTEIPFRRGVSAPELIAEICTKYGVKSRATKIIADRCRRVPGGILHPSDFERLLMDLDSGLKRRESMLIAEEYDLALETEKAEAEELRRGAYYTGRGTPPRRGISYYPEERYEEERYQPYRYERERPRYDRYGRRLPPEEGRPEVTRHDLEDFEAKVLESIRREKEADKFDKIFDFIKGQSEDIATLATELRNIKERPPVIESKGEGDYEKSLKHTIDRQDKRQEELMSLMRSERTEHKTDVKDLREFYTSKVDKLEERVREAEHTPHPVGKYRTDEIQFAAEGMHRLADVAEKKRPIEAIIRFAGGEEEKPPRRERVGESKIVEQIPPEYVD